MLKNYNLFLFESFNNQDIFKKGKDFTYKLKTSDSTKTEYKHLPCYNYVYLFMKEFYPKLNPNIVNEFKMAYKKDISSLQSDELRKLTYNSLQVPSMPETMRGLEYVNGKYNLGNIVTPDQAKIGDAISFWLYELIEFSHKEKQYSFSDTEKKFNDYIVKNKVDIKKLPEWLIEGVVLKYGHYGIISDMDSKYFYLSSSGEKNGVNGIWNGVNRAECSENFTKILKEDLIKFQKMSYDNFLFKSSDELSNKRTHLILRSYILNFIK